MQVHENKQSDQELLKLFLKHEQQIRKENPSLFWQLVERLTNSQTLNPNSPGSDAGVFYILKLFNFKTT